MRSIIITLLIACCSAASAQDYTIVQTMPNAVGQPGDMLMPVVHVQNSSSEGILMHFERIVLNLPTNWTSCFCYPHCIAPWIDTITFMVAGLSMDSITPNFCTDSVVPGVGIVQIVLYQVGFESNADTLTFTGTTNPNAVFPGNAAYPTTIFPNPATDIVNITNASPDGFFLYFTDLHGKMEFAPAAVYRGSTQFELTFLKPGTYFIVVYTSDGILRQPFIKTNN